MTYSSALHSHYLRLANLPVQADNFAGADARYSPEYEGLEIQLGKAASIHPGAALNWQQILDASAALLAEQSKDLRVTAWLVWGLFQRESFAGLHAGLGVLLELCLTHWDELHPRKSRTRAAALGWLLPRLEQALGGELAVGQQRPLFQALSAQLHRLGECLEAQLGAEAPLLLPLARHLDLLLAQDARQAPLTPASAQQPPRPTGTSASSGVSLDTDRDAHKCLRGLQEQARPLCAWWLARQAGDPRAVRLARTLLWLPIDSLPDCNDERITALRGLPADKLAQFQERLQQGRHAELLVELEASLARAPFWLDGQQLAWECLKALNAAPAMGELEIQLALLLQRLPGLDALRFHDGAPFASPATRAWIGAQVMPHVQPLHSAPAPASGLAEAVAPWEAALQDVLPLLRKEGLKPAVQRLKQGLAGARGGRETLFWHFALARLCHQARQYALAQTQLEALDQQLQASGLAGWEPALTLDILRLLHACYELAPQQAGVRERKGEVYRRLCHLDLEVVLD